MGAPRTGAGAARVTGTSDSHPSRPARAVVAGVLVGTLLAVLVAVTSEKGGQEPRPGDPAVAVTAFRRAWRHSLEGTYAVTWRFQRRLVAGRQVAYEVRQAQRPPMRLRVGGGVVEWRDGTRARACAAGPDGVPRCREAPVPPYERQVAADMELLAPYVSGPRALYAVSRRGEGCFDLRLRAALPGALYGRRSRFCFDRATGALVRSIVRRPEATDTYVAVDVRADVRDRDLTPPPPPMGTGDRGG